MLKLVLDIILLENEPSMESFLHRSVVSFVVVCLVAHSGGKVVPNSNKVHNYHGFSSHDVNELKCFLKNANAEQSNEMDDDFNSGKLLFRS